MKIVHGQYFHSLRAGNFSAVSNLCAILLLVIIVAGMAVKERFFCQFLCPMGAVFSLLPQFPFFRLRRGRSCLNGCQACRKNCPVSIKLQENPLRDGECISCLKCTMICPKQNIHYLPKIRKNKKMKKKKKYLQFVVVCSMIAIVDGPLVKRLRRALSRQKQGFDSPTDYYIYLKIFKKGQETFLFLLENIIT